MAQKWGRRNWALTVARGSPRFARAGELRRSGKVVRLANYEQKVLALQVSSERDVERLSRNN